MSLWLRQKIQAVSRPMIVFSALLLVLSYPPTDLGWLAFVALIPWLCVLEGLSPRAAWWHGYMVGLIFFGGTIWWLGHVTVTGAVVLVAYLALYFAAFSAAVVWVIRRTSGVQPLVLVSVLASLWTLLEWVRGWFGSGMGWNLLAHTQWQTPLLQWAEWVGVYGVSWIVAFVNLLLWQAWRRRGGRPLAVAAVVLVGTLTVGAFRAATVERALAQGKSLRVAVVQGNIPQNQKWDLDYVQQIQRRYEELTAEAARAQAAIIVWPETSVPALADDQAVQTWLGGLATQAHAVLLVGAPWQMAVAPTRLYNSALLFSQTGQLRARHDKLHLVPFGEFIPGEQWFTGLGRLRDHLPIGQFVAGTRPTVFHLPTTPPTTMSALICFEDLFPEISRTLVLRGARVLATITNDAWFGRTAAPLQHAQASVFRAVEHRVWMLRAANTGLSCAINPTGRIVADVHDEHGQRINVSGIAVAPITLATLGPTLYTSCGDWWLLICLAILWMARPPRRPVQTS